MSKHKLQKQIEEYIGIWVNKLGIADYKIYATLESNATMNGDYAHVQTDEDTRIVNLQFNYHRLNKEPHEVERTVIHELLHTRLNEYSEFVDELIKMNTENPKLRRFLEKRTVNLEHKMIVALANAFSESQES